MSNQEIPQEGGQFLRLPDGSLKRVTEDAPAADAAKETSPPPARSKKVKE